MYLFGYSYSNSQLPHWVCRIIRHRRVYYVHYKDFVFKGYNKKHHELDFVLLDSFDIVTNISTIHSKTIILDEIGSILHVQATE